MAEKHAQNLMGTFCFCGISSAEHSDGQVVVVQLFLGTYASKIVARRKRGRVAHKEEACGLMRKRRRYEAHSHHRRGRAYHDSERALRNKPLRSANFLCMDLQVVIFEEQQRGEPQHTEVVIFDGAQVCPVCIIHVKCQQTKGRY